MAEQLMQSKETAVQDASSRTPTREAATGCCGPVQQASCCEPSAKAACCGNATGMECGCR
jgi:hypothetical protein